MGQPVTSKASESNRVHVREVKIVNSLGLHARPAALFVRTASQFEADIMLERDGNAVSGKSIMGLMTMEAECGTVLRITAQGVDAELALDRLEELIRRKFDEE